MKFKPFVLFKESKLITKQAKAIFGADLVDFAGHAELVEFEYMEDFYKERLEAKQESKDDVGVNETGAFIDIGSIQVVIKFRNGKIVSFNSSEWGDISEVKEIKNLEE